MAWEVAFPVKNELGEGPVFDTVTGCLFWCDIIAVSYTHLRAHET